MLQNKIYQNYSLEILKTFLMILMGLTLIALTVRAVNFLDLIVENGYLISTYFHYSILNLFGIIPKFIPLSFLVALTLFIVKHTQDSELVILWTSGVKKIKVINLFFVLSIFVLVFYLILSTFITPLALNKSRTLLSNNNFNSFLPTVKSQQFTDSFEGLTFIVERKMGNEIENIFLNDKGNNLSNLTPDISQPGTTTIVAKNGVIKDLKMFLFNGQIISTSKQNETKIIKFEQLNIDLSIFNTTAIKKPKIQETSTLNLFSCFTLNNLNKKICSDQFKKEAIPNLNRRIVLPFYIPVLALISALILLKSNNFFLGKTSVFIYGFLILVISELSIRYTGLSNLVLFVFLIAPFLIISSLYTLFFYNLSIKTNTKWIKLFLIIFWRILLKLFSIYYYSFIALV